MNNPIDMTVREKIRLAMQFQRNGELEKAKELYRDVLDTDGNHPDALHLYGLVCRQQGDYRTAVSYLSRAVGQVPHHPVLRNNLGDALRMSGNLPAAAIQLEKAIELDGDHAGAHLNLGSVYYDSGNREGALRHLIEATRLAPERAEGWYNLGLSLLDQVRLAEAAEAFRSAVSIRPDYASAASALLYTLNLIPDLDAVTVAKEHRRIAELLFAQSGQANPASNTRFISTLQHRVKEGQPIRLGYISGDFRTHAVNYFFEPILKHHDASVFHVVCYSDTQKTDKTTDRLQSLAANWRDIRTLSDDEVLHQVQADGIDILVDLSGYTRHNRLGVFASRAAGVQLTYLGYPATTGLKNMDFRIVDSTTAPVHEHDTGSEQLIRLGQVFACYEPPPQAPSISPPPLNRRGFITFGSFHKLEKINTQVIELWSKLLKRIPGSRLFFVRDNLDDWQQQRLLKEFEQAGIEPERLQMRQWRSSEGSFLELFEEIDVSLDCFPWSGHTMACMSLWMGVPVIALSGDRHVARMVASLLRALGLDDWIADDHEAYVKIAIRCADDGPGLTRLRQTLRERMSASALLDHERFTAEYERALLMAAGYPEG